MRKLEQDNLWILAIYHEDTLQKTKERMQSILGIVDDDPEIYLLVQDTIRILAEMTEEEFQALDVPEILKEEGE